MLLDEFCYAAAKDLMVLQTPLLKVSRPVAACSRCRAAKIKCDGKLPTCSACERAGKQADCSSTNDQFARGKERSYVSTLETQVERLERRLREAQARKSSVISMPDEDSTTHAQATPVNGFGNPPSGKAARRKEALDIDDLVSDFGFLTVSATARDYYGFTSTMSYAKLILSACSKDQLPLGMTTMLPQRHLATITIQHYLDNTFSLLPLFDEASFYGSVDAVYNQAVGRASTATPFDLWCVRMVLAIAGASLSEQRGDPHYMEAVGHVSAALGVADEVLRPGSVSSVQALLLLVEYAMLDPHHFDSWGLIGAASRAMVDLGLHQDPSRGTPITKGKLELRRRLFHCVYALDRSTSLVQTRAFSFSDDSAQVSVPFSNSQSKDRPDTLQPSTTYLWLQSYDQAKELIKLRKLQSIWYTDLFQSGRDPWPEPYRYLWQTCQNMRAWFDNLGDRVKPHFRSFFELDLLYSYIYVLAPSPRVPIIAPFAQNLIFEYCIKYADVLTRLIGDRSYTAPLTFYDAMRVYMTGRQFIDVLWQNQDRLLSGATPELPHVPVDSSPPPRLPTQPQDTLINANRSIKCVKQLTDCLGHFGVRWGYMSWRDQFSKDAEAILNALNQRKWELQDSTTNLSGQGRRPSMWQHTSSTGSIPSETLSPDYSQQAYTPRTELSSGSTPQSYTTQTYVTTPSYSQTAPMQPTLPQGYSLPADPTYNYNQPPAQQFAGWHGLATVSEGYMPDVDESIPPPMHSYSSSK